MASPATIADFYKLSITPGTPVALGLSTVKMQSFTIAGYRAAGVANTGNVKWRPAGGTGWVIVEPSTSYVHEVKPTGTYLRASQIEIDVDTSGDGAYVIYTSAVVYDGE